MSRRVPFCALVLAYLVAPALALAADNPTPETIWMEAETFGPLKGGNFSYQPPDKTTKGSWAVAGPGVAPEWTQGGESEWMSIAARADEPGRVEVTRDVEVPVAGRYTLWVRYADYRRKAETFHVRVAQGEPAFDQAFGDHPVVDELDPMKLTWDWAFGWDRADVELRKGPARVSLYITGPADARRQVDCMCLTTDKTYRPAGREKPDHPTWAALRKMRAAGLPDVEPLAARTLTDLPAAWKLSDKPPAFVWNAGQPWLDELKRDAKDRVDEPFGVDPPLAKDFLAAYRGKAAKDLPVYGHPLSGPTLHVPLYPASFAAGSPFVDWLDRHPDRPFAMLLNYAEPSWPKGAADADKRAAAAQLKKYENRFIGYVSGESIAHTGAEGLSEKVKSAKSRADVLAAIREANTTSVVKKFSGYAGRELTPEEAFAPVISCLSANMEAHAHALAAWGERRVGHENTGNSPTLARRLAFLRGAARQFGCRFADYQSCNLGDSATMFDRQNFFYEASSRYILDNQYDAWAGAGVNWLLKDYILFHLAGTDAFYNEQGVDLFWKPGGNSAGDDFPVGLSPKGRVAEAVLDVAHKHPRGTQATPVAFLLDEAHGWAQERFTPGAFGMDPQQNPAVLTPGRHEDAVRGWFDIAYYPAPETQNEPATAIRQTYVNGIFGDIFDVIVTAPKRADVLKTYPVVVAAGEAPLTAEWGMSLRDYVEAGGTLVACGGSFAGAAVLGPAGQPPADGEPLRETSEFVWKPTRQAVPSNAFRFWPLPADGARVLATSPDGTAIATARPVGKGRVVSVAVPLGLGIDNRPVPILALLMQHLTQDLLPVKVVGDVEWTLNRLDDGPQSGWVVGLLNNRGVNKPQHGVNPTDRREAQSVTISAKFPVDRGEEWVAGQKVTWRPEKAGSAATVTVPAGGVRLVAVYGKR